MYEDLLKKYLDLESRFHQLLLIVDEQSRIIAELKAENKQLRAENESLRARLKEFEVKKNSSNSHIPPSKEISPAKKNQSLREKSGRLIGGQKGHPGSTLEMREHPDEVVHLRKERCERCGLGLSAQEGGVIARRQVLDLPKVELLCREYRQVRQVCACGHCNQGDFPVGVDNNIQYGENITSLVVYQNIYQYMPYHRLHLFFRQVFGISISPGTFGNMISRMAAKAAPTYGLLRDMVECSNQVGSDETGGGTAKGGKVWFWVWQNAFVTYIAASFSRGAEVVKEHFPKGLMNAVLNSDRWSAQLGTISKAGQLCLAHLLRDLEYLIQLDSLDWAKDFKALLKDAIRLKQKLPAYDTDDPLVVEIERRLKKLLEDGHDWEAKVGTAKTKTFIKSMRKHRKLLLTFLYDPDVPFDNNGSERAVRNIKVKLKISGRFKTNQQDFAVLRSIVDTTIKNGGDVFNVLRHLFQVPPTAAV